MLGIQIARLFCYPSSTSYKNKAFAGSRAIMMVDILCELHIWTCTKLQSRVPNQRLRLLNLSYDTVRDNFYDDTGVEMPLPSTELIELRCRSSSDLAEIMTLLEQYIEDVEAVEHACSR